MTGRICSVSENLPRPNNFCYQYSGVGLTKRWRMVNSLALRSVQLLSIRDEYKRRAWLGFLNNWSPNEVYRIEKSFFPSFFAFLPLNLCVCDTLPVAACNIRNSRMQYSSDRDVTIVGFTRSVASLLPFPWAADWFSSHPTPIRVRILLYTVHLLHLPLFLLNETFHPPFRLNDPNECLKFHLNEKIQFLTSPIIHFLFR